MMEESYQAILLQMKGIPIGTLGYAPMHALPYRTYMIRMRDVRTCMALIWGAELMMSKRIADNFFLNR